MSLKNVSDKPLLLFDYVGARPLTALWFGPEGKELPSKHYAWLKRADLAPANDGNFITLPPGGVHFIGPQSRESGLFFAPLSVQPGAGENLAKPGQHRVVLGYAQQNSATDLGRPGVWKGKVLANELTFTVE